MNTHPRLQGGHGPVDLKVEVLPGTRAVNGHKLFVVEHRSAAVEQAASSWIVMSMSPFASVNRASTVGP